MARYRKKPVEIEAVQFTGDNTKECCQFVGSPNIGSCSPGERIEIYTSEGPTRTNVGDFIIKEPFPSKTRRFYPCKPDIFEHTYEIVE